MHLTTTYEPSGKRALRPRARLLRTLGSDLISSEKVALIELVKNSFDADATVVVIRFMAPLVTDAGAVEVWDDGHGMDVETLQTSWLDIATDTKRNRTRSESGRRRVLGEKGIGRLAAARLANEMLLTTRRSEDNEVRLLIDWRDFDRPGAYLDEIEVAWEIGIPSTFIQDGLADGVFAGAGVERWQRGQGSVLQLELLTRSWGEDDVRELRTTLQRLIRPRPRDVAAHPVDGFKIFLDLPSGLDSLAGEVGPPEELSSPTYHLVGSVDSRGVAQLHYSQNDPEADEALPSTKLWLDGLRKPRTGPFELDIQVWDRDRDSILRAAPSGSVADFRRILDAVAGVSVYRDSFRVLPFGEIGDDWLGLDRRRVQNPTMRLSNNQVIGHIFIEADANVELRDQSNREGLLEGAAYEDLQKLMEEALRLIETKRYAARRKNPAHREARTGLFQRFELGEIRNAFAVQYPTDSRLIGLIDAKTEEIREGVEEVQRVLSQYSRLATLGALIDRVLHDGRTSVSRLKNIVRFGERDLAKAPSALEKVELLGSSLRETGIQAEFLSTLFNQIEPFSGRKRGKPRSVSMRQIAADAVAIFLSDANDIGATIQVECEDIDVRVDPSELLTVLVNLIQNALYWVSTVNGESGREVLLQIVRNHDESVTIVVNDSGPGVPEQLREYIFDPYFSDRPDGVGLGLSIAGNIIETFYGGQLTLLNEGRLPGAAFSAVLRKRV